MSKKEIRRICVKCKAKKYAKYLRRIVDDMWGSNEHFVCENKKLCVIRKKGTNYRK